MSSDREQTTPPVDHVEDLLPSTLKKKKKKSGGRKKRRAITGFEGMSQPLCEVKRRMSNS